MSEPEGGEVPWHDPTHGRIDRDIQEAVAEMEPVSLGQRCAIENTLQTRRDRGHKVYGVYRVNCTACGHSWLNGCPEAEGGCPACGHTHYTFGKVPERYIETVVDGFGRPIATYEGEVTVTSLAASAVTGRQIAAGAVTSESVVERARRDPMFARDLALEEVRTGLRSPSTYRKPPRPEYGPRRSTSTVLRTSRLRYLLYANATTFGLGLGLAIGRLA